MTRKIGKHPALAAPYTPENVRLSYPAMAEKVRLNGDPVKPAKKPRRTKAMLARGKARRRALMLLPFGHSLAFQRALATQPGA